MATNRNNGCSDPSIPSVNNNAKECCELYSANCVVTSEYQDYFKVGKGKTLTFLINKIASVVKSIGTSVNTLEALRDYREVYAILNQSSTNAPTGTFVKNETYIAPTLARVSSGKYTLTIAGAFTGSKTFISIGGFNKAWGSDVKAYWVDVNTIAIESGSTTDFIDDDVIVDMPIKIKIFE